MSSSPQFDLVVYGASGFTGQLVAEHLAKRYGVDGDLKWAVAGRSAERLRGVLEALDAEVPLIVADADDPASLDRMLAQTHAVLTTVGPYQLYGSPLVGACAARGVDYLDLCGEVNWMRRMIDEHQAAAERSGARILFSCGFDSIPFELGVYFTQGLATAQLGHPVRRMKGRVRAMRGGLSGGTAASAKATFEAIGADPSLVQLMADSFALTPGFAGPAQPAGDQRVLDPDLGLEVGPFMMASINTRNVHRSNQLQGHAYGADFVYDEMAVVTPGAPETFTAIGSVPLKPGEGPSREERDKGFYDLLFIGEADDGRKIRGAVRGDRDPGYGSTSKIIAETAICLLKDGAAVAGGVWTPGAALGQALIARLTAHAGLTITDETDPGCPQ
ncbi:MAG TPA: saccharopine dehydrogenase NADP-binding domain-containing protein [Caulobacteraceae bacterium]|nr:saccharopine dehydrogenase NADP-binding domain-containing protein [Caulobacteraceae bacterium]